MTEPAPLQASVDAQTTQGPAHLSGLELLVLLIVESLLLIALDSHPAWFDSVVGYALWPQVNHVLDGAPLNLSWRWADMYQHNAGQSPLYSALVLPGLHSMGLSLLAVRLPLALLALVALLALHFSLRAHTSPAFSLSFLALLGSSPWYLLLARSGGILSLSLSLSMLTLAALLLMLRVSQNPAGWSVALRLLLGAGCGVLVALLPYGHTSTRLLALLLAVFVPLASTTFERTLRIGFICGLLALLAVQLADPGHALQVYFQARGEGILATARSATDGSLAAVASFVASKLLDNGRVLLQFYLGYNDWQTPLRANLAASYWLTDSALYPHLLVPAFVFGWLACRRRTRLDRLWPVYLLITLLPGLLAGLGNPNAARLALSVVPLYALIACGLAEAYERSQPRNGARRWHALLGAALLLALMSLQAHNFFAFEKGGRDDKQAGVILNDLLWHYRQQYPQALIVLHELPVFHTPSYVIPRWRGGARLQQELASGRIVLLHDASLPALRQRIEREPMTLLLSEASDLLQSRLADLPLRRLEQVEHVGVYVVGGGVR